MTSNETQKPAAKERLVVIPEDAKISDLEFGLDQEGLLTFNKEPLYSICNASGVRRDEISSSSDPHIFWISLIAFWYGVHLKQGGELQSDIEYYLGDIVVDLEEFIQGGEITIEELLPEPDENESEQRSMTEKPLVIPKDLEISDLEFGFNGDEEPVFNWGPIYAICEASGIDEATLEESNIGFVYSIIVFWYGDHLENGGEKSADIETMIDELRELILAEDNIYSFGAKRIVGNRHIHKPGTA